MDHDDLHPTDDYSHRFFIWHEWLQANGPLTAENVFDYFATSMFYDKQSNNQVLRMQTMHTGQPILNEAEELKRFTGIEFALVHAQPPSLFIIHKRERLSPEEVRPLAAYFIMHNRIYQSPDLYTVLSNRLLTSLHSLQSSLDVLRVNRPDFTPRTGFVWPIVEPLSTESLTKKRSVDEDVDADIDLADLADPSQNSSATKARKAEHISNAKRQQNIVPLMYAMHTTAIHSAASFVAHASESIPPEVAQEVSRSSETPAHGREETPGISRSMSGQDNSFASTRPSLTSGKKKKKRSSPV